jgi:hypothetical protein
MFQALPSNHPYCEFVMRLIALSPEGDASVQGSGLNLGNSLCLTARHVFNDFLETFGYGRIDEREIIPQFDLFAAQVVASSNEIFVWRTDAVYASPHVDAILLHLTSTQERQASYKWKRPFLQLLPPAVGSRVHGFGYAESRIIENHLRTDQPSIHFHDLPRVSVGSVREIHPVRRDASRLNFPCFRTNLRIDGGMSGGPVINDAGEICGINCSTLEANESGQEPASYHTCLYPLMGLPLRLRGAGLPESREYHLLELARRDVIHCLNHDRITLRPSDADPYVTVDFRWT